METLFDAEWYLDQNPDVAEAVAKGLMTAWQHFEMYGQTENRSPLSVFNSAFYWQQNPDVSAAVELGHFTAAQHFAMFGVGEVRTVSPAIDLAAYLEANTDVAQAVEAGMLSPLYHLFTYGLSEPRDLGNGISISMFADDPVFQQALTEGNLAGALARIDAVAPFVPDFVAPEGWAPGADTPIPVDFVPPAGSDLQLQIPEGVEVPEGLELPDTFQPQPGGDEDDDDTGGGVIPLPDSSVFTPKDFSSEQGSSDASTALPLDGNFMVVADDEGHILRVYDRDGGPAVAEWSIRDAAVEKSSDLGDDEIDLEASTRINDTIYYTGSHSNKKSGSEANEREFLFSVKVSGTGAGTTFELQDIQDGLEGLLKAWDASNAHGKGAAYFGLADSSAAGVVPEQVSGFSIEGMTASLDGSQLLLGFRAPQTDTLARENALIIPVTVDSVFTDAPVFGDPIELNLGGRGIRSIEQAADGSGYLVLAGPAGSPSDEVTHDFRLYSWTGNADNGLATGLTELEVRNGEGEVISLDSLLAQTGGSFETLVEVASLASGTRLQLLQDNGDTVWEGQTKVSKDLDLEDQQFVDNWVVLGDAAANDAPGLVSSNIGADTDVINSKGSLSFRFDEAVRLGAGSIVLKQVNGDEPGSWNVIQTFSRSDLTGVSIAYNSLVLDPTLDLEAGAYQLDFVGEAITDLSGMTAGLSPLSFTVAEPEAHKLLITEVSSKHSSDIDFFELYNYGSTAIDLSGWRWTDSSSKEFGTFAAETSIAAGDVLVVATEQLDEFLSTWDLTADPQRYIEIGGPGLGKEDAVILYDGADNVAASFNYSGKSITALDGSVIESIPGGGDKHAGEAAGATDKAASAVWDAANSSAEAPTYIGSTSLPGESELLGTPGWIATLPPKPSLLITEVNSKHGSDIDFFELYNYGSTAIDLSGWRWTDSKGKDFGTFAAETSIAAGDVLVVATEQLGEFLSTWDLTADPHSYIEIGGPGLGKGDAVIIYDASDKVAASFNYSGESLTALDGTVIASIPGGGDLHAGQAAGATNEQASAVWDAGNSSVDAPIYIGSTGLPGGLELLGTPGQIDLMV
nr:lamin tail domain-containing protein [Pusillimonas sp. MFBS29]